MKRIVLVGESTPLQKVLYRLGEIRDLSFVALYTKIESDEIEAQARQLGIPVRDLRTLVEPGGLSELRDAGFDWLLNVNSTVVFSQELLDLPRAGALNMHPGRLPDYAGLHVHQWAIRNGETRFASTLHWMVARLDAGDIAYTREFDIREKDTGLSLFMRCLEAGTDLVLRALVEIASDKSPPRIPQDLTRRHVYSARDAADGTMIWTENGQKLARFVRAADYSPFQSPTYTPVTPFENKVLVVRKAIEADSPGGSPGTIVGSGDEGLTVAAGNGTTLCITRAAVDEKAVRGMGILEALEASVGDRLGA